MSFMDFISEWAPKWPFPSAVEQAETYSLFIVCAGGSMTFALDFCACTEDEAKLAFNDMLLLDIEREEKGLPKDGTFSMFLAQTRHVEKGRVLPKGARLLRGFDFHGDVQELLVELCTAQAK